MAAGEDELEPLVRKLRGVHGVLGRLRHFEQAGLRRQRAITADAIDRPVARGRHEPGARAGGRSLARPALGRDREGLLRRFLGEVEVAEEADQRGQDAPPLVAERLLEDRHHSTIGRTSTAPPMRGCGDPRGELDRGVEVGCLEQQVAADRLLELGERAVGGQRPAVLHAHRGRGLGRLELEAGAHAGRLADRLVRAVDRAALVLGKAVPLIRGGCRGGALMDQQHVLHRLLLSRWSPMRRTSSAQMNRFVRNPATTCAYPRFQVGHPGARTAACEPSP